MIGIVTGNFKDNSLAKLYMVGTKFTATTAVTSVVWLLECLIPTYYLSISY